MQTPTITRRRLAGSALLLALAPLQALAQGLGGAPTAAGLRFRSVAVDLSPIIDHGGGAVARTFGPYLLRQLRTVFADRLDPGDRRAPLLTARITNVYLTFNVGRGADLAFGNNDTIEGDGIVTGGGLVASSTHVLTELPASYSGNFLDADIDQKRLDSIAYQFAYWLRREMAL